MDQIEGGSEGNKLEEGEVPGRNACCAAQKEAYLGVQMYSAC